MYAISNPFFDRGMLTGIAIVIGIRKSGETNFGPGVFHFGQTKLQPNREFAVHPFGENQAQQHVRL